MTSAPDAVEGTITVVACWVKLGVEIFGAGLVTLGVCLAIVHLMTGDGVNDAPALAKADVGIAIGASSDVAVETADVILMRTNAQDVVAIVELSRATYRKLIQNLLWATGYNVVAIPLAAGALYAWGVLLTPALGAVLMSASTVIVAFNARLLNLKNGEPPKKAKTS